MRVLQVISNSSDNGILAFLCPIEYPSYYANAFEACSVQGDLVFMAVNPKENDYVDDQKITLPDNQCFVPDGTFSYVTRRDMDKRVRKIKLIKLNSQ